MKHDWEYDKMLNAELIPALCATGYHPVELD